MGMGNTSYLNPTVDNHKYLVQRSELEGSHPQPTPMEHTQSAHRKRPLPPQAKGLIIIEPSDEARSPAMVRSDRAPAPPPPSYCPTQTLHSCQLYKWLKVCYRN